MNVRVLIDGRPLVGDRTGIGVHTAEIASRLGARFDPVIASHQSIENTEGIEDVERRVDRMPLGVLWQQLTLPRVAEREQADVVWGPHGTLPLLLKRPAVVSLHDLTSITMPAAHRLKTILSFNPLFGQSLDRAVRIMSVSRFSADELIRGFAVEPGKIEVVPNGVSEYYSPSHEEESDERYILYVGSIEPRKGIADLIAAWETLQDRPRLILAGSRGWKSRDLLRRIERREDEIVVTGFVDRPRLRELYRNATLFVYPSHFEGFGLPVLEAMACGTPVITTTGGALPEAAGDAAELFPPSDAGALARIMRALLSSPERRQEMTERGLEHARKFSWEDAAKKAGEIFRFAAEHGR